MDASRSVETRLTIGLSQLLHWTPANAFWPIGFMGRAARRIEVGVMFRRPRRQAPGQLDLSISARLLPLILSTIRASTAPRTNPFQRVRLHLLLPSTNHRHFPFATIDTAWRLFARSRSQSPLIRACLLTSLFSRRRGPSHHSASSYYLLASTAHHERISCWSSWGYTQQRSCDQHPKRQRTYRCPSRQTQAESLGRP